MSIIDEVEKYVKERIKEYKNNSEDQYDYWEEHIKYVYEESLKLADKYNADKEIVSLGALLHDIALINEVATMKDHNVKGESIAREVLTNLHYDENKTNRVLKCVYNHRSSHNAESIEEICVADGDILAHFDNISLLYYALYVRKKVSINNAKDQMNFWIERDYNNLSDKTKEAFKEKYEMIKEILIGK